MRYNDVEPYAPLEDEETLDLLFDIENLLSDEEAPIVITLDLLSQE